MYVNTSTLETGEGIMYVKTSILGNRRGDYVRKDQYPRKQERVLCT